MKNLIPLQEEFAGHFESEALTRSMEIQMNRIFNYVKSFGSTNTTLVIKRIGFNHLIIHPLGEDGETLDINLDENWTAITRKKQATTKGIKWLHKNYALPEKGIDCKDMIVTINQL